MLVFVILGVLLLISIGFIVYFSKEIEVERAYYGGQTRMEKECRNEDVATVFSFIMGGIIGILLIASVILVVHKVGIPNQRLEMRNKKDMYEYKLRLIQKEDNTLLDGDKFMMMELYEDILSYNNKIDRARSYGNSLWLNWFFDKEIQTMEKISLELV